ncbi:MAG: recombinase family protein [Oscillospiraceae bacterium]|nr:recombinase family protein [Oscillospiraceae bacterium]
MKFGISLISTKKQDHQKQIEYLLSQNVPDENIIVITESGKTRANSIVEKLKEKNVQSGDEVVFECFDRIGRNIVSIINAVEWCEDNKIEVYYDGKFLDRSTEQGEMETLTQAFIAEMYRIRRSHQSKKIIARDKANGTYKGGRPALSDKKIKEIKKWQAKGLKPAEISKITEVNRTTVYKYL